VDFPAWAKTPKSPEGQNPQGIWERIFHFPGYSPWSGKFRPRSAINRPFIAYKPYKAFLGLYGYRLISLYKAYKAYKRLIKPL
jgi:hypothetical protein